jgi:hypothetical protein
MSIRLLGIYFRLDLKKLDAHLKKQVNPSLANSSSGRTENCDGIQLRLGSVQVEFCPPFFLGLELNVRHLATCKYCLVKSLTFILMLFFFRSNFEVPTLGLSFFVDMVLPRKCQNSTYMKVRQVLFTYSTTTSKSPREKMNVR